MFAICWQQVEPNPAGIAVNHRNDKREPMARSTTIVVELDEDDLPRRVDCLVRYWTTGDKESWDMIADIDADSYRFLVGNERKLATVAANKYVDHDAVMQAIERDKRDRAEHGERVFQKLRGET